MNNDIQTQLNNFEGHKKKKIAHFKHLKFMQVLQYILNVLTIGIFQFFMDKPNFRRFWLFRKGSPEDYNHVEIIKLKVGTEIEFSKIERKKIRVNGIEFDANVFVFDSKRYFVNPFDPFEAIQIIFELQRMTHQQILNQLSEGIKDTEVAVLTNTYGKNKLNFKIPSILEIIADELFAFIYYFQVFSFIVWSLDNYHYYVVALVFITLISLFFSVREKKKQMDKIRLKLVNQTQISIRRNINGINEWLLVNSSEALPGDLIMIKPNKETPIQADIVLIKGNCLVNESGLTGETRLVPKNALSSDNELFRKIEMNVILYAGSKCESIFGTKDDENGETLGLVLNIGFSTLNGQMIKSVLTPKIDKAKIEKDLNKFLLILIGISLIGSISYIIFWKITDQDIEARSMVIRALELLTIGVPPFLGLCLIQSNYYAILRIEADKIGCLSHYQLNIAGTIQTLLFDKTGTITENELTLKNFIECSDEGQINFSSPHEFSILNNYYQLVILGCHSLYLNKNQTNGDFDVEGDMLEVEMFRFTKALITEGNTDVIRDSNNKIVLTKKKTFQFSAYKKRMGALVEDFETKKWYFVTKGAYESINKGRIDKTHEKLYSATVDSYAKTGSRIIALAIKELNQHEIDMANEWTEEDYFNNLTFIGFLNFNNAVKENVKGAMTKLEECDISKAMISGDNEYACAFIGYKVGIMNAESQLNFINYSQNTFLFQTIKYMGDRLLVVDVDANSHPVFKMILDNHNQNLNNDDLDITKDNFATNKGKGQNESQTNIKNTNNNNEADLLMASDRSSFNFMLNNNAYEQLKKTKQMNEILISHTRIYSRMTPSTKSEIVDLYKVIKGKEYKIGFVGDGANDVRAMKKSDIGISFLGCEASISAGFVIPFNQFPLIIRVIAEGKACLENCMNLFKYISFYALAQFSGVIIQYFYNLDYKTGMYYIQDIFIVIPISILLCFHGATDLVKEYPLRTLFSVPVFVSIFGSWLILLGGLIGAALYVDSIARDDPEEGPTRMTSILFLLVTFNINTIMLIFVRGKPFRKSITSNKLMMGWFFFMQSFLTYMLFMGLFSSWEKMNEFFREKIEFAMLTENVYITFLVVFCSTWTCQWILNRLVFYIWKLP